MKKPPPQSATTLGASQLCRHLLVLGPEGDAAPAITCPPQPVTGQEPYGCARLACFESMEFVACNLASWEQITVVQVNLYSSEIAFIDFGHG